MWSSHWSCDWDPCSLSWTLASIALPFPWDRLIALLWPIAFLYIDQLAWAIPLDQDVLIFIVIYFLFYFDKKLNVFLSLCLRCSVWSARYITCILSTWNVTKHRDWSLSLTGINWVSDGVSINFTEYMYHKDVHFFGSLKQMIIIDFWEKNRVIPMGTKLLLLSNRLKGF